MTRGGEAEGASQGPDGKPPRHVPVLISEVLEALAPKDGEIYIDGTFGAGGYTRAILQRSKLQGSGARSRPECHPWRGAVASEFGQRLTLVQSPFSQLEDAARDALGGALPDGVVLDIGVSSMQLDDAGRGFSFQHDGPLDMRMSDDGMTAADFVNDAEEEDIANVIYTFGEEHKSRVDCACHREAARGNAVHAHAGTCRYRVARFSRPQGRRAPPGDADVSGAAHLRQRRARRTGRGLVGGGTHPEARRPAGRRFVSQSRRPDRQKILCRAKRQDRVRFAAFATRIDKNCTLQVSDLLTRGR